ncbi:protein MIS12 homolog [Falco biarmicus]|uniref:Protein MIS12 homolog n=1 Tax=Falco tinnunculus TaxID=100819 RepID=A0A8C4ULK0_FALTI|nr:protein MIS12 homolog [Falco peregrinus]XP_005440007.1 protein MIS12 homolog [Falco cherrug]XP_037230965.1 protein MIS12 homolog [Falco rusticolus]XP_040469858.1 protein MIS12 homolog [Falco naumanni]XP_056209028.1 protein MIS12 homolog [Falco biarmicus]
MSVDPMAYEAQFFGFTPQTCILRVYIAFQDYLFETMLLVESVMLKKLNEFPGCKISPFELRKSTEKFLLFMKERFDKLFSTMEEMLLQLVLNIPKNTLLPEDKVHEQYPYSKEQFQVLQDEVHQLQEQYRAEVAAGQALHAELEEQKVVQAELEKILQWFDGLENTCRKYGISSFKESFTFLAQNSKKLQDILNDVEKKSKKIKKV